jgi:hypothetical protein
MPDFSRRAVAKCHSGVRSHSRWSHRILGISRLAALVEGGHRSLSNLASLATDSLNAFYVTDEFTMEVVSDKLKVLATRKQYVKNPSIFVTSASAIAENDAKQQAGHVDRFQDEHADFMWRGKFRALICYRLMP